MAELHDDLKSRKLDFFKKVLKIFLENSAERRPEPSNKKSNDFHCFIDFLALVDRPSKLSTYNLDNAPLAL